jgi:pimeloyl-ACP methyl ester carboxylesterase
VAVNISPAELAMVRQPALFVWGDADAFMRPGQAAEHIKAIPNARLVELPDVGHAPWLQSPEVVAQAVASHLDR